MIKNIKTKLSKRIIITIALLLIALLSIFFVSRTVAAPSFNATTIKSLDEKKVVVMKLTAAAATAATAISLIPGDTAMPIANQIAELSTYFLIILCAILLEKMLIAVVGYVSFTYIIPFACLLSVIYLFTKKEILLELAIKLAIFGIILFLAIPASIKVSDLIYSSYKTSIEQSVENAKQNKEFIEQKKKELDEEKKKALSKSEKNWLGKIGDYVSDFTSTIGGGVAEIAKKGEDALVSFLDAISILIITSCIIPILVILFFIWIIKILFGFDIREKIRHEDKQVRDTDVRILQKD